MFSQSTCRSSTYISFDVKHPPYRHTHAIKLARLPPSLSSSICFCKCKGEPENEAHLLCRHRDRHGNLEIRSLERISKHFSCGSEKTLQTGGWKPPLACVVSTAPVIVPSLGCRQGRPLSVLPSIASWRPMAGEVL